MSDSLKGGATHPPASEPGAGHLGAGHPEVRRVVGRGTDRQFVAVAVQGGGDAQPLFFRGGAAGAARVRLLARVLAVSHRIPSPRSGATWPAGDMLY